MIENYDVKVEGGAFGLIITEQGVFKGNLGKVYSAICPKCWYLELYLEDTSKLKKQTNLGICGGVRMKQIISLLLSLFLIVTFSGCHNSVDTGDMPPMIDMYGQKHVAPNMPVNELPQGYTYLGELSKEQANGTGLEGCKMYAVTELDSIPDFYLYQECGTPIDDNTVDSEKIQWAYVQWIKVKAE